MQPSVARSFLIGLLVLGPAAAGAPPVKKKAAPRGQAAKPEPAQVKSELKPAPVMQPVPQAPTPESPASATAAPIIEAVAPQELTPLPRLTPSSRGLSVQATGGLLVPFSGLRLGGRAELRASYWMASIPLAASVGVAFEQHTSRTATLFAPPAGGLDEAALINQTLVPIEVGALAALFRDEKNRVHLGVSYGLLAVWSQTIALGETVLERGAGHEISGEAGYTRRLGALELTVRFRYSMRRTAVGLRTSSIEPPWYQTFGVLAGLGFWL